MRVTQSTVKQFYAHERERDGEGGNFQVGHKFKNDFTPMKAFKLYSEAERFYLERLYEEGLNRNLIIRDLLHRIDSYLMWRNEEF